MIINVCGVRDSDNISAVSDLDIDWIGFVFWQESPRYVRQISSRAGTIPDYSSLKEDPVLIKDASGERISRVGVFVNDMPQTIVTRVVNYHLDVVQLHGDESPTMMENLRRTLDPDIRPGIKLMKTIYIKEVNDLKACRDYSHTTDYFLFEPKITNDERGSLNLELLTAYDGDVPFMVGGNIGMEDVEGLCGIEHPLFAGINIESGFETEYAVKDVQQLKIFVERIREMECK